jgi:hypothetical protein
MASSTMLHGWSERAAEQLNPLKVWQRVCDHLKRILANLGSSRARRRLEFLGLGVT